jgi:hypothetical protein
MYFLLRLIGSLKLIGSSLMILELKYSGISLYWLSLTSSTYRL